MERLPARGDFTLEFWLKTAGGGYGGWVSDDGYLPRDQFQQFKDFTEEQKKYMAVLMTNVPVFEEAVPSGMIITLSQPRNYASIYFQTEGQETPIVFWKLRKLQDDRWHHLVITVERQKDISVYVDGSLERQENIAAWNACDLPETPLFLGMDTQGEHKVSAGTQVHMELFFEVWNEELVRERYFCGAVEQLGDEIQERKLEQYPFYEDAEVKALKEKVSIGKQRMKQECAEVVYKELRKEYETFLLNAKQQPDLKCLVLSDTHCEGAMGKRTETLRKAVKWAEQLGMDMIIDGGDCSAFGRREEMDSYWNVIKNEWKHRPLFFTMGNHETIQMNSEELRAYHCRHLAEQGMVEAGYDHFYYEGELNGYHMIVLSQYSETYKVSGVNRMWVHAGEIKQEQITFLKERLDRYCGKGKPVIVIIHNVPKPFLDRLTHEHAKDHMAILDGEELYKTLEGRSDVILCFGHIHRGFAGGTGIVKMNEGYYAWNIPGFRCTTFGYGMGAEDVSGVNHGGYFAWLYGRTWVLRAVDFASGEWLTAYDQIVTM